MSFNGPIEEQRSQTTQNPQPWNICLFISYGSIRDKYNLVKKFTIIHQYKTETVEKKLNLRKQSKVIQQQILI